MLKRFDFAPNQAPWAWWSLLVLPLAYQSAATWARFSGGPLWLWFNLDPDYFYLLDALNIVDLATPGHVHHPGTTVQWLGALILKLAHLGAGSGAIVDSVLADPEAHLRLIGGVFVSLNAFAQLMLGAVGYRVFGDVVAAWLLQTAPMISMVVLKHSVHAKPESLLLLAAMALAAAAVLALSPGSVERHRRRFAVAFGVIAGFGVATKVTALPVFVLPLFVLMRPGGGVRGGPGAVLVYGASALAALVLFALPAAANWDVFFAWMATVSQGSGAYGGGAGFVDWQAYPAAVIKLFKRPAFHVVFLAAVAVLAAALARRRRGRALPEAEVRLLAGVVAAQLAQVLLVAKQPNAVYMIPSFVLIPLAFVLVWRLGRELLAERGVWALHLNRAVLVVLAVVVVGQGFGMGKLARELAADRDAALALDDDRFRRCVRVYTYAASSPSFALLLGDYVTGGRFAERLARTRPRNDYWLDHWWDPNRLRFRGWRGPADIAAALAQAPCVMLRGGYAEPVRRGLPTLAPGLTFDATCATGDETVLVRGADCAGRALK